MGFDINDIIRSAFELRILKIRYRSSNGTYRWRWVEPYKNIEIDGHTYLFCYDVDKDDTIRLYRMSRISDTEVIWDHFSPRWTIEIDL